MSNLQEPMFEEETVRYEYVECQLVPPFTSHEPCSMPDCGRSTTGKWAEALFRVFEARPLARGPEPVLSSHAHDLIICQRCHELMSALWTDRLMTEEKRNNG